MTHFLDKWVAESSENARAYAEEEFILEVSEKIFHLLDERGMTRKELADLLGTSKANISQLLNGNRNMTLRSLAAIAFSLDLKAKVSFGRKQAYENVEWSSAVKSSPKLRLVKTTPNCVSNTNEWTTPQGCAA